MIDFALYVGYALIGIAALSAIVLPLIGALNDPKSLVQSGIGVAALLVVFFLGYLISGNEVTAVYSQFGVDASLSKTIGGAVTMMYLMLIIVIGAIVFSEISKLFR